MNKINLNELKNIDIAGLSEVLERISDEAPNTNIGGLQIQQEGNKERIQSLNVDNLKYENELDNGYKLDWLSFTVSSEDYNINDVLNELNYDISEFEIVNGRYFYNSGLTLCNYVNVYYNDDEKMKIKGTSDTVNYVFTGQGCTDLYNRNDYDVFNIFEKLLDYNIKVTRLDIAFDDFHKLLDFKLITQKLNSAEYRSSKKSYNIVRSSNCLKEELGSTIYVGNPRNSNSDGNFYVRMYDKKAQYEQKKLILPAVVNRTGCWQRYEISYTKKKANEVYYSLMLDSDYKRNIDKLYKATMRNIIEFLEVGSSVNKSRWKVCDWWEDFLKVDDKMSFVSHERDVTMSRLLDWIESAVIPNLKLLELVLNFFDYDVYELLRDYNFNKEFSKKQMRLFNDSVKSDKEDIEKYLECYLKLKKEDDKDGYTV